jgi:hypothetical protein
MYICEELHLLTFKSMSRHRNPWLTKIIPMQLQAWHISKRLAELHLERTEISIKI